MNIFVAYYYLSSNIWRVLEQNGRSMAQYALHIVIGKVRKLYAWLWNDYKINGVKLLVFFYLEMFIYFFQI